jgi:Xaa-Pro aminopeptidase
MSKPLATLRELMKTNGIHAFLIPSEDPHQSEYIASCHQRRGFISGFTGSAGTAIVTLEKAALWTDGRYYLQASQQLSADWILQKHGLKETPSQEDWLIQELQPHSSVGIDPELITYDRSKTIRETLEKKGHKLVSINENLVDKVWDTRPAAPNAPICIHDIRYAGESHHSKIKKIQELLVKNDQYGLIISALDEIAWLFNLRGSDIAFNPVFLSYALVTPEKVYFYVDEKKVTSEIKTHLEGIVIKPYTAIFTDLDSISKNQSKPLLVDKRASLKLINHVHSEFVEERNPVQSLKSIKNPVELQGFRDCHCRDAVALINFFSWLEIELVEKKNTQLSEAAAADRLQKFRR